MSRFEAQLDKECTALPRLVTDLALFPTAVVVQVGRDG